MKISDMIEAAIREALADCGGCAQIQRNELASRVGCAPSQVNYVITTRFNGQSGYLVESRRGGGGCIVITRMNLPESGYISYVIEHLGNSLSYQDAQLLTGELQKRGYLSQREAALLLTPLGDQYLNCGQPERNRIRCVLFQNMLAALLAGGTQNEESWKDSRKG